MGRNSISDVRKPEILRAFIEVIDEEGLAKASIAKVAKHMGTFPSLIQHYFGSRENLVLELIDLLLEDYQRFYHSTIDACQDPQAKDSAILDLIFSQEWSGLNGQLVYLDLFSMAMREEKIRVGLLKMNDLLRSFLRNDLNVFRQGEVNNPEQLLDHIVFLLEGFHMWGFARSEHEHSAIAAAQKRLVIDLLAAEQR